MNKNLLFGGVALCGVSALILYLIKKRYDENQAMNIQVSDNAIDISNTAVVAEEPKETKMYDDYVEMYTADSSEEDTDDISESDSDLSFSDDIENILEEDLGATDYNVTTLSWYTDGVMTDQNYGLVDNPEIIIGDDSMDFLETHSEGTIYVRNNTLKGDYEVVIEDTSFEEIVTRHPYLKENY